MKLTRTIRMRRIEDTVLRLAVEGVTSRRLANLLGVTLRRGQQIIKRLAARGLIVPDGRSQIGKRTLTPICWVLPGNRRIDG